MLMKDEIVYNGCQVYYCEGKTMIRVSKVGKLLFVCIRRHDTMNVAYLPIGSDEVPSERQTRLRFKQALKLETARRKF